MLSFIPLNAIWAFALSVTAQSQPSTSTTIPTASGEPCAEVYAYQSQAYADDPSATFFRLPPDVAYACLQSIQLDPDDTLSLLTGLDAWFQWQSTLAWLKDPPAEWPFPAVDLIRGLKRLSDQVQDGTIMQEIDFQTQLVDLITSMRDGHLTFAPDAYMVFEFFNPLGSIVSVSVDGTQLPEVYLYDDLLNSDLEGWVPSSIETINGTDVVDWLTQKAFNETMTHQDLDALYNRMFYSINAPTNGGQWGYFNVPSLSRFYGSSLTLTFTNGSELTSLLLAGSAENFTQVVDGDTFYQAFCNMTLKAMALENPPSSATVSTRETSTQDPNKNRPQYPLAVAISSDGALAGYFLDDEPDVAVLSILSMSEDAPASFQATLTKFLDRCRETNKTRLIIDVSQNGGGDVLLAYDLFKQLFPTLDPYLAGQFRAHPQADVLGEFFTPLAQEAAEEQPDNFTLALMSGTFSLFSAIGMSDDSGRAFESWDQLYGPVEVHGGQFSEKFTLTIEDPFLDMATGSIVVSGYANNSKVAPQPFQPENMILFGDGYCASSCTIFSHLMKYQGKVKSIVAGGRPQPGPAQAMGGVKGSRVQPLDNVLAYLKYFSEQASSQQIAQAEQTQLGDLSEHYDAIQLRRYKSSPNQVNILNAIAQHDDTLTPLQFVYEAADCRLWYQPRHFFSVAALWQTVAEQAFGLNGVDTFALCVDGSTGHPSSLSGNAALFDGGRIANVSGYSVEGNDEPEGNGAGSADGSGSNSSSSGQENGSAASAAVPAAWASVVSAAALGFAMLLLV